MKTRLFFLLLITLLLQRCKDDETFVPYPTPESFKASAFIEVKDVNGNPLSGVEIEIGQIVDHTDDDGLLYLRNVDMNSSTYLTASLDGYFHGSRRFYPSEDQTHFIHLILLPTQLAGTIESTAGGNVQVSGKVVLDFPADAIVDHHGQLYAGSVSVMMQPIAGDDPELSDKMPGDLVGFTEEGNESVLASFGMVAVELRSNDGDLLQIKEGMKVEMRMEVPASMVGTAPTTIPMWYFDEELGYWKEEGEATLTGNQYVANLGHFSYWNCDASFDLVKWGATFVFEDGSPASQVLICLTILELNTSRCAITNDEGVVCGLIAANEAILMEVKDPCGDVVFSQEIGPYSDSTMLGPISIPNSSVTISEVSGNAVNCNDEPVVNGFVKVKLGTQNYYDVLDEETGEFSVSLINCAEEDIHLTVVDEEAFKQSVPLTFSFAPVIDAGTINVCETITEFVDLEVVGFPEHFVIFFPSVYVQNGYTQIYALDSAVTVEHFYVYVEGVSPGNYSPFAAEIGVTLPNGDRAFAGTNDITITFTYFGDVGDYILGTVSGTWHTGPNGQGGPDYPLSGTFSILRE